MTTATESKKLQTSITPNGSIDGLVYSSFVHDARIAHEQRDVINQLVRALQLCQPSHPYETEGTCLRGQALAAAAPYLD